MSLVNTETGEIVDLLDEASARDLTDRIKNAAESIWTMLLEAHDRRAWQALGYGSWRDYATTEFGMSQSHAYRVLDQAKVIGEIEAVAGSPMGEIVNERAARDIKPRLKEVTRDIKREIENSATVEPERVQEIVADVIAEHREKKAQQAEDRAAIADLNEKAKAAGMDVDEKSLAERGGFSRLCMDLSKLAPPAEFLARHRAHLTPRHIAQAERAYEWLDTFLLELKEGK